MRIQVAVVDSDKQWRNFVRQRLRRSPHACLAHEYETSAEAVKQVPRHRPGVVLAGLLLPGINCLQCVRRLRQAVPGIRIVLVAEIVQPDIVTEALCAGADGYVLKPEARHELVPILRQAAAGRPTLSSEAWGALLHWLWAADARATRLQRLSPCERQVLKLLARGLLNKEVADRMGVELCTVKTFLERIRDKLEVPSRTVAVAQFYAFGNGES